MRVRRGRYVERPQVVDVFFALTVENDAAAVNGQQLGKTIENPPNALAVPDPITFAVRLPELEALRLAVLAGLVSELLV
jgi:hypothetical protein